MSPMGTTVSSDVDMRHPALWVDGFVPPEGTTMGRLKPGAVMLRLAAPVAFLRSGAPVSHNARTSVICECGRGRGTTNVPGTPNLGPWCGLCVGEASAALADHDVDNPPAPPDRNRIDLSDPVVRRAIKATDTSGRIGLDHLEGVELLGRPLTVAALRAGRFERRYTPSGVRSGDESLPINCPYCLAQRPGDHVVDGAGCNACRPCIDAAVAAIGRVDEARGFAVPEGAVA